MTDIVERLRKGIEWTGPTQDDTGQTENLMGEAADEIERLTAEIERLTAERDRQYDQNAEQITRIAALEAENEKLRAYALKAFTVVEFCSGQGFLLQYPNYDCDDLLMEGVVLLNVETSEEARAALEGK